MKTFKSLTLKVLLFAAMCNLGSCFLMHEEPEEVAYFLFLGFTDASGNDLVKDIEMLPANNCYRLDVTLSEPCKSWNNDTYNYPGSDVLRPTFWNKHNDGNYNYLTSYFYIPADDCPEIKKLTYKLKYPELFGDNEVHEFVSYWTISKNKQISIYYATCERIEFDGKKIIPTPIKETSTSPTKYLVRIALE